MVLFPPYTIRSYTQVIIRSGYGFLFALPQYVFDGGTIQASVNVWTLAAQIAGALIVGGLMYLAFRELDKQAEGNKTPDLSA
jgi:hypothetical protein